MAIKEQVAEVLDAFDDEGEALLVDAWAGQIAAAIAGSTWAVRAADAAPIAADAYTLAIALAAERKKRRQRRQRRGAR